MVVVEPLVSLEKLRDLLAEQAESPHLDYKAQLDPRIQSDLVELAKDIGAMEVEGGYIVIGVNDQGNHSGALSADVLPQFDEARLRGRLRKYLPEPLTLLSARHKVADADVVLLYVGPSPDGFAIFTADGQYQVGKRPVTAFRQGDVYVRHGTASERWNQADIARILGRILEARKEEWRTGLAEEFRRLGISAQGRQLAGASAGALTWNLDAESFEATVIEQLRLSDDIPVRLLVERAPTDVAPLLRQDDTLGDFRTLLDRLSCLAALGIRLHREQIRTLAILALGEVYDLGFTVQRERQAWAIDPPVLWLEILRRVVALGGLAVRCREWPAVRELALRRGEASDWSFYRSWMRHGLTMAARSRLFTEQREGHEVEVSLLSLARSHADQQDCLSADLPSSDERLLDSLCQFDALAALAAIADVGTVSTSQFYPNFARFYTRRTEPIIARLLEEPGLRTNVFPGPDHFLAEALRAVSSLAAREGFRFAGWDGYTDDRILKFLQDHPPQKA